MKKLSVLLLIMSFVGNSFGQNLDNEELFEMSLEELMDVAVISASKTAEKSSNAPSTIYAISKEQISVRGYSTLEELLEDIPEIEIQRKSVTEYSNYFTFRGIAGNERFLILQNGVRIASVTGSPHAITHNYPVAHAERVEVILGPASALYGADAFTGIVNIITQSGEKVDGGTLTASYGSFNTTDNSFVAGGGNEKVAVMATGKFYSSDEPNMSDFYEDEYSWYLDEYSQNGNVIMSPDFQDTIGTSGIKDYKTPTQAYFINTQISIDDVQIGYIRNYEAHNSSVAGKPEYNVYSQDATYNVMNQIIYLQHDYTSDNSKWNVQSTLSHSLYELEPESKFINTFTNFSEGFKYANSQKFKFDEKVSYSFTDNYKLMAGFTFEDINALPKTGDLPFKYDPDLPSDLQDFYYLGTNITNGTGEDLTIMQDFYHLKYQNYGGYLQFQGKISEQLRFVAGGRVDYNTRYGASVNPRAGIVSKPIDKLSIKLLYGRAYLAPSPYNAYQHYGAFVYNSDNDELTIPFWHLANPDLKPETINTFEMNAGYYLTDNIGVFIDGYYNSAKNLVVMEGSFDEVFHGIPVGYAHIAQNNGEAETYGGTFRINAKYNIGNTNLNAYAAYSYSDGEMDGNPLPYSAPHTAKFGLDITHGKFSLSPRGLYRSPSKHGLLTDANGDLLENDAFVLINLYAKYKLLDKESFGFDLFVKANNLLNQKYYNVSLGGAELFGKTPQDPIRIMGGVTFTL